MATPKQRKEFYELYGPIVEEKTKGTGLYPQVVLAQLALESAYGTAKSAKGNLGGRKLPQSRISSSKKGVDYEIKKTSEHFSTKEEADAFAKQQKDLGYKVYGNSQKKGNEFVVRLDQPFEISGDGSAESNVQTQIDFFLKNPRYEKNGVFNATSPKEQAELLKKAGYATDANYASKIENIYNQDDFPQYTTDSNDRLASQGIDSILDPTAQALGLPTSEDIQTQLQAYNDIKAYEELAASDPSIVVPLPNQSYDPDRSISEQYLEFNPELTEYFQGADNIPSPPSTEQPAVAPTEDLQTKAQAYNDLRSYDDAVAAGQADFTLANPNYDPDRPQAEQYLDANPDLKNYLQGAPDPSQAGSDPLTPPQSLIDQYGDDAYVFWKNMTPEMRADYKPTSYAGDPASTGRAPGYEGMSAQNLQNIYQGLLKADAAAAAAGVPPALVSGEFEEGPQAPQFLARRMQGVQEFPNLLPEVVVSAERGADFVGPPEMSLSDPLNPNFVGPPEAPVTRMAEPSGNYDNPDVRPKTEDPVKRNMLSKLKGQDYMGLLSDIGGYAARMAPLQRALRDASSYDEERYPRFAPIIPTATLPKRDVRDAFATAQQAAMQQGKLDLGALSALATQQAKETARVEENVANERVGLLNQAQQLNNQITMQEMADTAANKGAAQTMKYQALAAMSEMGQGSLREANMRRNDKIVKEMFASVFDELDDIKGSIG